MIYSSDRAIFQRISEINTIIDYAPPIFNSIGLDNSASLFGTIGIGIVDVILTMEFTVIGTETGIQQAADELPERIDLSIKRIGRFETRDEAASLLIDKQAALLALAIEVGYYEVPRKTTQRALADRVGVAPGTVGDRLQRIERRVMTAYAKQSKNISL